MVSNLEDFRRLPFHLETDEVRHAVGKYACFPNYRAHSPLPGWKKQGARSKDHSRRPRGTSESCRQFGQSGSLYLDGRRAIAGRDDGSRGDPCRWSLSCVPVTWEHNYFSSGLAQNVRLRHEQDNSPPLPPAPTPVTRGPIDWYLNPQDQPDTHLRSL